MFEFTKQSQNNSAISLIENGYWPARAQKEFDDQKYSKVVELCRDYVNNGCTLLSGRLLYAKALFHAGQVDSALQQLFHILSCDSDNIAALKYLGDCKFKQGDELGALNCYQKVWSLDVTGAGRAHGFFSNDTFYLVWLDREGKVLGH